jgi:AcrR family transcriptional regulator
VSDTAPDDVDGRRARRHRNSDKVLDAVHELFVEGYLLPTVEDVARRSGVSLRSVYRYFPDRHQLLIAALGRRMKVAVPLFRLDAIGEGTREERIERYVDQRLRLYDQIAPTVRAALSPAAEQPAIVEAVQSRKRLLSRQTRQHFAEELEAWPKEYAADVLLAIELLFQFESVELLRAERGLSTKRSGRVLATGLASLLASSPSV